ncbi:hypothetical protein AMS68_004762 [Peltaster fructicola]|uniref:Ketoreductase (KR) domain-containing protein n=1 Tax=Peltaster fructicola TaxID=286661 RepID=A0A6H0XX54_9PEZI|nr:hypothetical protein AMS68_004762 [Peltaster fructicola]
MPGKTIIILGSGPGIGTSVASAFAVRGFTHVALVARNKERLAKDQDSVLDAIQERGYSCQVKTWQCDLSDFTQLKQVLKEIESFGSVECVLFNAARVSGESPLKETTDAIEADFRVSRLFNTGPKLTRQTTNLALYEVAQWAIPLLKQNTGSPSLFVTSTTQLYKEPHYDLFSLSMVKSAQRALVLSLNNKFGKDVHIALLSIGGVVSPDAKNLSPENIADKAWELYKQPKKDWQRECEIDE